METPQGLLARLAALGIEAPTVTHPPVFTVAESKALRPSLPGGHVKNLFLRPEKAAGPFLLAVLEEDRQVKVNALVRALGAPRAVFAEAEALRAQLGVEPGSVTPLGLVNAAPGAVRPVLDRRLVEGFAWIHVHPLTNTMTTAIRPADLLRFLRHLGHAPEVVDPPEAG
ncbi:prolyl-tRNA synthetase associated domain-containing protein [Falsiroseomonas selenitidurans]|uniref:Prolyl-tRNA synthetase associated domain-containing protein n=1 Tax=Falsiroseomonas selenitidurans TaxID=2716335 RepID=A0ABX1E8R8_9PROT|nr:prolyl-tRNA synthetase associated domain-containing protein [Falsiroseomonas selenitidurans]NKC33208.1 prolyl-tRNA synthetase associated domain-containing protein [Falsiroseomonas selenitidurans]